MELSDYKYKPARDIELDRCVKVSKGKLRYVEICRACIDPVGATVLIVRTLATGPDDMEWWKDTYWTNFGKIWASQSYKATGMRAEVPALAAIHPSKPDVVYMILGHYLFGLNVPEGRVVEFVDEQFGMAPGLPICWRNVLIWGLTLSKAFRRFVVAPNQHRQQEAFKLWRREILLKAREDKVKRLEGRLEHALVPREVNDSWDRTQTMLTITLTIGLTFLLVVWSRLSTAYTNAILIAFGAVWVIGCIGLVVEVLGTKRIERLIARHSSRLTFLCLSLFIFCGLYWMSVSSSALSPESPEPSWTWIEAVFSLLAGADAIGQIGAWIAGCCTGADFERDSPV